MTRRGRILASGGIAASAIAIAAVAGTTGGGGGFTCNRSATTSTFATQVSAATAGQSICLASGDYGSWTGASKTAPGITVTPASGASVTMGLVFTMTSVQNITVDGTAGGGTLSMPGAAFTGSSATARNITVKNAAVTEQITIDGPTNSNMLFDHNTHNNIRCTTNTARFHLSYPANAPSGVTIQNSLFDGSSADGIQAGPALNILNNEFRNIREGADTACHTDAIQLFCGCGSTGVGSTIRGNWIHDSSDGIVAFDGTNDQLIEHNVLGNMEANNAINLGDDTSSVVQWNTTYGTQAASGLDLTSKAGAGPSTGETIRNNAIKSISLTGGGCSCTATPTVNTNNMLLSGAGSPNFNGTPTFAGGSSPSTFTGFALATGSAGKTGATDGGEVGAFGGGFTGGPPAF